MYFQESVKTKHPQLHYESKIYSILQGGSNSLSLSLSLRTHTYLSIYLPTHTHTQIYTVHSEDFISTYIYLVSFLFFFLIPEAGIPNLKWFGVESEYNVMIIDLLGPSLEDLFNYCNRKFTLKTVLMLADQLVSTCSCSWSTNCLELPGSYLINLPFLCF